MKKLLIILLLLPIFAVAQTAKEYIEQGKAVYKAWLSQPPAPVQLLSDTIRSHVEPGNLKAIRLFTKAIALEPDNLEAYKERVQVEGYGWLFTIDRMPLTDYKSLIADYTTIIRLSPGDTTYYYERAQVENRRGNHKEAIDDLKKLAEINPKSRHKYYGEIVMMDNAAKDYSGSLKELKLWIGLEPNYTGYYYQMARVYMLTKDYTAALQNYDKALALGGKNYAERSRARYGTGDYKGALEDEIAALKIKKAVFINESDFMRLGELYAKVGDYAIAIENYTNAITLMSATIEKGNLYKSEFTVINPYQKRAEVKFLAGDREGAMMDYDTAIKYNPEMVLYNARAEFKNKTGDKTGACEDWNIACTIGSKAAKTLTNYRNYVKRRQAAGLSYIFTNELPDTTGYGAVILNLKKYCK